MQRSLSCLCSVQGLRLWILTIWTWILVAARKVESSDSSSSDSSDDSDLDEVIKEAKKVNSQLKKLSSTAKAVKNGSIMEPVRWRWKLFLYCLDGRKPSQSFLWCSPIQAHQFLHGLYISHNDKRFVEFNEDGKQLDVDVHRKYIFGGPAATYMASLMKENELNLFINPRNVWVISLPLKRTKHLPEK